jgi:hypothetical protein
VTPPAGDEENSVEPSEDRQRNEGIYTGARRFLRGEVGWMF